MPSPVLSRAEYLDAWAHLHGGHDPRAGGRGERGWFAAMYSLARPLAGRGASPDALSGAAVLAACAAPAAVAVGRARVAGPLVVVHSVLDGLDGAVALLAGRSSRWGHLVDSLGDRVAEAALGAALVLAGAPAAVCVGAVATGWLQEYARARAAAGGLDAIVVVTVAERPTRLLAAGLALFAVGAVPSAAAGAATTGGVVWLGLGAAGLAQLLPALRRELR
jgi:phosphatidylglycerophosphate synthase